MAQQKKATMATTVVQKQKMAKEKEMEAKKKVGQAT